MLSGFVTIVCSKFRAERRQNKYAGTDKTDDSHSRAASSIFVANPTFVMPIESD